MRGHMSAEPRIGAIYLDSSAIVKLVIREPETDALRAFVALGPTRVTSALARAEVPRALRRHGRSAMTRGAQTLRALDLLVLDDALLDQAAALDAEPLRSLDAIHIASAQQLGADLAGLVTYDTRMIVAARSLGLPVATPT